MRPDDAFWAARIVAQFSDEALAAIVKAQFREQRAADYILSVLTKRRDKVVSAWLNGVNPVVDFRLAGDGTLTFDNAALLAKTSTAPTGYAISWSRFDNATDTHQAVGPRQPSPRRLPAPRRAWKPANMWPSASKHCTPTGPSGHSQSGLFPARGRRVEDGWS